MPDITFTEAEADRRLADIGQHLAITDRHLLAVLATRLHLTLQVAWTKSLVRSEDYPNGMPISRPEVEDRRLEEVERIAREMSLNPHFARALLYEVIGESCKLQMIAMQSGEFDYSEYAPEELRANLLALTKQVASGDEQYSEQSPATRAYVGYEQGVISRLVTGGMRDLAIDLGCGDGSVSNFLAGQGFSRVIGLDLSPDMIALATSRASHSARQSFRVCDLETDAMFSEGFVPEGEADLVVMTLGTASDIPEMNTVIGRIRRLLKPRGKFLLSFYNGDAFLYQAGFTPWQAGVSAIVDPAHSCVNVRLGEHTFYVYGRTYTLREVEQLLGGRLTITSSTTFPALAAYFPSDVLGVAELADPVHKLDLLLAGMGDASGAYLIVTGIRP